MFKRKRLVFNTALLTGSSLIMSLISMSFQVWLASRIGSAGIGLYQLVLSVSFLCTTFAISGVRFAATRLVAEEIGSERARGVAAAMKRCFAYSLFFGISACVILINLAEPVGFLWIGDARTVLSLRIMAFSMPFISLSSVMGGYFTACGRVWKSALVHFSEQLVTIALVAFFLAHSPSGDIEKSCASVMLGSVCGDIFSFVFMLCLYLYDKRRYCEGCDNPERLGGRMLKLALPLAASAYARSSLSTLEHLLVPRGLKSAGFSADRALSGYGVIQGMVMPIISFPACLLIALAELIVPELTELQMKNDTAGISRTVSSLLLKSAAFSALIAAFMFVFSDKLGMAVYHSQEAGHYIRLLAPLIPVMYTDTVTDGCLKGLNQQLWSMGINILDALCGVLLVWLLLPKYALSAYIGIIYFNECLNFSLSIMRLRAFLRGQGRAEQRSQR